MMKLRKGMAMLVALCMLIMMIPVGVFATSTFAPTDIIGHWAQPEIQSWIDGGLIVGYPDGTFKPGQNITRAEFIRLVNVAFGYTEGATINYTDVQSGSWYYSEVAKAEAAGYIDGYGDGTMKPGNPITREEAAKVISVVNALTTDVTAISNYSDKIFISGWAEGYVGAVTTAGIMKGYPDGSFTPKGNITRAESVFGLDKALDYTAVVTPTPTVTPTATPTATPYSGGYNPAPIPTATPIVDKTALETATATMNAKVYIDYTAASWATLKASKIVIGAMPETTQTEVDAKKAAINAAIATLVVNNKTAAIVTVGSLAVTQQYGLALNFTINEAINFDGRANIKISYFTKNGGISTPISNTIEENPLVKDKTWDGYLWSGTEAAPVKYSKGTAGVASFLNVIPADTILYTLVKNGFAVDGTINYTAITDWTVAATYVVKIEVTDNDGNISTVTTVEVAVNP